MVYKGAKHLRFLSIHSYLGGGTYNVPAGRSPYAEYIDRTVGVASTMATKSAQLNNRSAYSVAASSAALANQSGGNIGFTYE